MSGSKQSPGIVSLAMQDIFDFIEQVNLLCSLHDSMESDKMRMHFYDKY